MKMHYGFGFPLNKKIAARNSY